VSAEGGGSGAEGGGSGAEGGGSGAEGGGGSGGASGGGSSGSNGAGGDGGAGGNGSGSPPGTPRSAPAAPAAQGSDPAPLINTEGSPGLVAVADVVNSKAQPLQALANLDASDPFSMDNVQTVAGAIQGIQDIMDVGGMVTEIIDTGFATLTAPIAALFPALPALTLGALHIGLPHTHTHPPSLVPPAPPIPLPSLGAVLAPGCVNVLIGGIPAARCGDIGMAVTCGSLAPPFEIATGSSNVFIGGRRAARLGDLTKHCQPSTEATSMPSLKSVAVDMAKDGLLSGLADGSAAAGVYAAVQVAAEAAAMAIKALLGKDPGLPPLPGGLVGPPLGSRVSIGGFPCPGIGEFATAKMGGLLKKLAKRKKKGDSSDSTSRENNGDTCNATHPVYLITGENFDSFVDYAPGTLFEWRRHYTSARGKQGGPIGHGWRHFYQRTLVRRLHRATFTNWDGQVTEFGRFELGEDTTRAGGYVLRRLAFGHYRISRRNEPELEFRGGEFDNQLPLVRVSTPRAHLDLAYDRLGRLSTLTETPADAAIDRRQFELVYDQHGHIAQLLEVDPKAPITNGASGPSGAPHGMQRAAYTYSDQRDLTLATDSQGGRWTYRYDAFHRLTEQADARGYRYDYGYDASGRCIKASGQDGLWWCKIEYFPEKRFTRCTEGDNATWEYHYDGGGTATRIVDPFGGVRERRVDALGRMSVEVDSGGRTLQWLYDADGAHFARIDRFGNLFPPEREMPKLPNPFARNLPSTSLGWLLSGRAEPSPAAMLGLDPAELAAFPPEVQRHAQSSFRWRQSAVTPVPPVPPEAPRTELDRFGRKVREEDALGRKREWHYDATGNLVASVDRDGRRSTQETASWNLLGARIDPLGNSVKYEHSKLEQITAIIDPLGNESRYEYDRKQRLVRVHRHGVLREEYVYDAGDHFIEKRDGQGNVLFTNSVHENHFVATRALGSGGEHIFDYDAKGRITQASTEAHDVRIAYGSSGLRIRDLCDGQGVEHAHVGNRSTTTRLFGVFEHAARFEHHATQLSHADGSTTRVEHADAGLIKRRASNGTTEVLQFNEVGQLEASLRYRRGRFGQHDARATRYAYSAEGDLLEVSDSERGATRYETDAAHRLLAERTPDGRTLFYGQDSAGNLVSHPTTPRIDIAPGNRLQASSHEAFQYDARNQLAARTRFVGAAREPATTRYHYDSFDMLTRIERREPELPQWLKRLEPPNAASSADAKTPDTDLRTWSSEYDALGRRLLTRWTTANGLEKTRRFYWDGDRLAAELLPDAQLRIYEYATHQALVPLAFTDYASIDAPPSSGRTYHVFVNPVGIPLSIEDGEGNTVWYARRIDPYGQVDVRADSKLEYNLRWPGHYFDPETGLHYNRYRYYDPKLGRYLQSDPMGHEGSPINLYAYCPNPLVQVDVLGLDHPDRTDGADGATKKPGDVDGREGTEPPKLRGVSDATVALAASPGSSKAHIKARKLVAKRFYKQHGKIRDASMNEGKGGIRNPSAKEAKSQLKGIDYSKPVKIGPPDKMPAQLEQWQRPGGTQGQFYAAPGTQPQALGIHDKATDWDSKPPRPVVSKVPKTYEMNKDDQPYMQSTAAPIKDTWSVEKKSYYAEGGAPQYYVPNSSSAAAADP
jgi:RHS repeat-associated protein